MDSEDEEEFEGCPMPGSDRHSLMNCMSSWFMTRPSEAEWKSSLQIGKTAEPERLKKLSAFGGKPFRI